MKQYLLPISVTFEGLQVERFINYVNGLSVMEQE